MQTQMMKLNRLRLAPKFDGLFEDQELRQILSEFAEGESLDEILALHDGELLRAEGLELFQTQGRAGIRLKRAVFVQHGTLVKTGPLEGWLPDDAARVWIAWEPQQPSEHTTWTGAGASLTFGEAVANSFEIARFQGAGSARQIAGDWWPAAVLIGSDDRSLQAAARCQQWLPKPGFHAAWLQSRRLAKMRWPELLTAILPLVPAEASCPQIDDDDNVSVLWQALCRHFEQRHYFDQSRLIQTIEPAAIEQNGEYVRYRFQVSGSARTTQIAIVPTACEPMPTARLLTAQGDYSRPLQEGQVGVLGTVQENRFEIEMRGAKLLAAACYEPHAVAL